MIERLHRWIKERSALIAYDNGLNFIDGTDDWSLYLNIIMYQYNITANSMTTHAPSEIIFGRTPTSPKPIPIKDLDYKNPLAKEYIRFITNQLGIIRNKAITAQEHYDALRKHYYDKNANEFKYKVGQDIMYNISSRLTGNKRKLKPNWIGPYEVVAEYNNGMNYKLCDKVTNNTFDVHRKHLKPFIENKFILINTSPIDLLNNHLYSDLHSLSQSENDIILMDKYVNKLNEPFDYNLDQQQHSSMLTTLVETSMDLGNLVHQAHEQHEFINKFAFVN